MKFLGLKSYSMMAVIVLILSHAPNLALAADIDCNPNADCSRRTPLGKVQDPICQGVKKLCQAQCGNINQDASKHIQISNTQIKGHEDKRKYISDDIVRLKNEISALESQMNSSQSEIQGQNNLLLNLEALSANIEILEVMASEFREIEGTVEEQIRKIMATANQQQKTELSALVQALKIAKNNQFEISDYVFGANPRQVVVLLIQVIAQTQTSTQNRLSQQEKDLSDKKSLVIDRDKEVQNIEQEVSRLRNYIDEQEKRKCTPW